MCNENVIPGELYEYVNAGHIFVVIAIENTYDNIWRVRLNNLEDTFQVCACDLRKPD